MESVLTKNINALRKNYPGLAETIEKMCLEAEDTASDYIIIEYTKTNQINFRIDYEDKSILLHSAYDPNKEAEKWIEKYDLKYKDSLAILGVGAGYHIEALVRKYPNKNKIIIEPNKELFIKLIKNSDVSDILKADNTLFIVSDNSEEIAKYFLGLRLGGQIDNIEFMELISYERLYRDWWQNFKQEFIKYTKLYQINLHTSVLFKKEWFLNFCENAKVFSESVTFDNYKDVFKDIPAIIVSAGPSLNKNIELLKNIKDKAIIISCGSAINILESRGIVPHVMAGIDPGKDQSKIFGSVKSQDIFFLYTTPMYYEAVRDYKGPKLYYRLATAEYAKWFEDKIGVSTIPTCSGASVSNVTVDIARTWGCNPIILIGQDLGFTGKEVYADGAVLKEQWDKDINERIDQNKKELYNILTDIYGQPIYTDQAMLSIKVYFEEYVKSAKDIHLLNCTEGGVPIDGVENRSLREVIKQYCIKDYNIDEMLRDIYNKEISKSMSKADDVDKFLKELYNETLRMKELALKRIKLLYDTSKKGSIDKNAWRKIDKLTEEIEKMDSYKNLIGNVSQIFLQALKNENERSAEKTDSIKEKREILISGLLKQYGFVSDNVSYVNSILSKILM